MIQPRPRGIMFRNIRELPGTPTRLTGMLVYRLLNLLGFAAGQLAVFQGASEAPISELIRAERATRKNSQLAAARRVALKMGRRLRCSSVTYRFRYAPSSRLADGPFLTQRSPRDLGDGALADRQFEFVRRRGVFAQRSGMIAQNSEPIL